MEIHSMTQQGAVIKRLWTCDNLPLTVRNAANELFDWCCYVNWLAFWWGDEKKWHWKSKTKCWFPSFFFLFICWFIPRCEYDSMFVQNDVILNVDFFLKKYWTAACTITTCHYRPLCLAVDCVICLNKHEVRKLKWGRKSCFGLLLLMGSLRQGRFFYKINSLRNCLEIQVFFYVTYLIWNCFIWIYMEI